MATGGFAVKMIDYRLESPVVGYTSRHAFGMIETSFCDWYSRTNECSYNIADMSER